MGKLNALDAKVTPGPLSYEGTGYVTSTVGNTGPGGPPDSPFNAAAHLEGSAAAAR